MNTAAWKPPFSFVSDKDFDLYEKKMAKKRKALEAALVKKKEFEDALAKRKKLVQAEIQRAKDDYAEELLEIYEMKDKIEAEMRKQKARVARSERIQVYRDKLAAIEQEMVDYVQQHAETFEEAAALTAA